MDAQQLKELISNALPMDHIQVEGDGRHWFATLVSPSFEGLSRIKRHQLVYATLGQRMQTDEVHALSMKTLTPTEWAQQG
jgi:acid stress-induced BolA-like protein IbaG/YrbA